MEKQFFMGMKNNWHNLLKRILLVITAWVVISTILVNALFVYFQYYVEKQEAKIFYDVQSINIEEDEYCKVR